MNDIQKTSFDLATPGHAEAILVELQNPLGIQKTVFELYPAMYGERKEEIWQPKRRTTFSKKTELDAVWNRDCPIPEFEVFKREVNEGMIPKAGSKDDEDPST
jgi:hypothetical protein